MKILGEKTRVICHTVRNVIGVKCDVCESIIDSPKMMNPQDWMRKEYTYYRVTTGHHDWGNDSCESIEHQDICPNCVTKFVSDYLTNNDYQSAYIDIETKHTYYNEESNEE